MSASLVTPLLFPSSASNIILADTVRND